MPPVPHHTLDCMLRVLAVDRKLASNMFAVVQYFWSMSIVFEWLQCSADKLFARILVAMDSGYCYIAMGSLCVKSFEYKFMHTSVIEYKKKTDDMMTTATVRVGGNGDYRTFHMIS